MLQQFLNRENPEEMQPKEKFTFLGGTLFKKVVFQSEHLSVCTWLFKENALILEKWKY